MKQQLSIHNFDHISSTQVGELGATLHQFTHTPSGARLVWLERPDENKTFGIAFRTLPWDDTGVFHILEHSVLCGSERYPVKEPFVDLLKSSMQTFLNAMTFPDKTYYPVSSRNPKDFLNLVRVYLDAVFHPVIYTRPEIFQQEGWHYELDEEGNPSYKGVVFNEMKGAMASPDALMQKQVLRLLFPDTPYRYVSGGDPAHIPALTYQQFLDSHRRFYAPSNAYIVLDGSMELQPVLALLDEELSTHGAPQPQPEIAMQAPVTPAMERVRYEVAPNEPLNRRARLGLGYVVGDFTARLEVLALQALGDALCGSNQAPLKHCLLSQGLAEEVRFQVVDGIQQSFVLLEVLNLEEERAEQVEGVLRDTISALCRDGLDHQQLSAVLANMEFQMRERDYGSSPQGLGISMSILDSWLYGGGPADGLEVGGYFRTLNEQLEQGYFEALLARIFLHSDHRCKLLLLPSHTLGAEKQEAERARLAAAAQGWSEQQRAEIRQMQQTLRDWQATPDAPEDVARLPRLALSDISPEPEEIPTRVGALEGVTALEHTLPTGGIDYVNLYFHVGDVAEEELPALSLLCTLLGKLDTARCDTLELQKRCRGLLGNFEFGVQAYTRINQPEQCLPVVGVSFSALEDKLAEAAALVAEMVCTTRFDDGEKVLAILRQRITRLEQSIAGSGASYAMQRGLAGVCVEGVVKEQSSGVAHLQWLKQLLGRFDQDCPALLEQLSALARRVFTRARLTVSTTGTDGQMGQVLARNLLDALPQGEVRPEGCVLRPWGVKREGIVAPTDISFAVMAGSLAAHGGGYDGQGQVLSRMASLDYLWNAVRVQGGAYGAGMVLHPSGAGAFYSYRDPNAQRSLACYAQTAGQLEEMLSAGPDLTGFIIGAVAESEPLLLPHRKGKLGDRLYFQGVTQEHRRAERQAMLSVTAEHLGGHLKAMEAMTRQAGVCIIGARNQVEACRSALDSVFEL